MLGKGKLMEKSNIIPMVEKSPEYHEQIITRYSGNPLIEALTPILSKEDVIRKSLYLPEVPENIGELDSGNRYHYINFIKEAYSPPVEIVEIERAFSSLLKYGYVERNPINRKEYLSVFETFEQEINLFNYDKPHIEINPGIPASNRSSMASTYAIVGPSGMGKTLTMNKIIENYNRIIIHTMYAGNKLSMIQIPTLKIQCPHDASPRTLAYNFCLALDELFGGRKFVQKYASRRYNKEEILDNIKWIAFTYNIGVLIIDELQNLDIPKGEQEVLFNFFDSMTNMQIPIIYMGTPKMEKLFKTDLRHARRMATDGVFRWQRMMRGRNWDIYLGHIWKCQYVKYPAQLTEELNRLMYDCSQGIPAIVTALFMNAQRRALDREEKITPAIIKEVYRLLPVLPMIEALRRNDNDTIKKYEDISIKVDEMLRDFEIQQRIEVVSPSQEYTEPVKTPNAAAEIKEKQKSKSKVINFDGAKDLRKIYESAVKSKTDITIALKNEGFIKEIKDLVVI